MKHLLLLAFFLLNTIVASASSEDVGKKIPAGWVWQVTGGDRVVFLVGEMHKFTQVKEEDIDVTLGLEIYHLASKVFTEKIVTRPNPIPPVEKLSKVISAESWQKIVEIADSVVKSLKLPPEKELARREQVIAELDNMSAAMAQMSISVLLETSYALSTKIRPKLIPGLTARLMKLDTQAGPNGKIEAIEPETIADDVWRQNCNTQELSQQYIDAALSLSDFKYFRNDEEQKKQQNAFKKNDDNDNDFMRIFISANPSGLIMLKCNIIPRNNVWINKISEILKQRGEPVAVYVGLAHLLGENGLVEKLRADSRLKVERIYSIVK